MRYSKDSISRQAHSELIYGGIVLKTFRWGMIGLGAIANAFAEEALESVQNPPYAVAARSLERAQEFAKRHHAQKAYGSYEELFADPDVDMVYIATPTASTTPMPKLPCWQASTSFVKRPSSHPSKSWMSFCPSQRKEI